MFLYRTPIRLNPQKNYKIEMKAAASGNSPVFGIRFNANLPVYCLIDSSGMSMEDSNFYIDSSRRNTYAFVLRKDGYVSLYHYGLHRTYQRVMPWIKAKKVSSGDNVLGIVNSGNHFAFLLNGAKIFQKDIDVSRGFSDVGMIVNKDNGMSVDYLRIDER